MPLPSIAERNRKYRGEHVFGGKSAVEVPLESNWADCMEMKLNVAADFKEIWVWEQWELARSRLEAWAVTCDERTKNTYKIHLQSQRHRSPEQLLVEPH